MSAMQNECGDNICIPHSLCTTCRHIVESSELLSVGYESHAGMPSEQYAFHKDIRELKQSANDQCHSCVLILSQLKLSSLRYCLSCKFGLCLRAINALINIEINSEPTSECEHPHFKNSRTSGDSEEEGEQEEEQEEVVVYDGELTGSGSQAPMLACISLPDIQTKRHESSAFWTFTTSSAAHMNLAGCWLLECLQKHEACRKPRSTALPKRLIYVGSKDEGTVHLFRPRVDEQVPYLALSYCWGDGRSFTRLQSTNEEDYLKDIPFDMLPLTLKDAITFTRALGVQYLWIDCLCIMQDSPDDKRSEIARMGSIFQNSICTIVASGASNSDGGCFQKRNPLAYTPCNLAVADSTLWQLIMQDHGVALQEHDPSTTEERAWCFQEYVLSPRLIVFGKQRMTWHCMAGQAGEREPCGFGWYRSQSSPLSEGALILDELEMQHAQGRVLTVPDFTEHPLMDRQPIKLPIFGEGPPRIEIACGDNFDLYSTGGRAETYSLLQTSAVSPTDYHLVHQLWFSMVSAFSERKLTFEGDKAIALAGIVDRLQSRNSLTYLAGLWLETSLQDLLWFVKMPAFSRPAVFRAPSWSWIAVDAPISAWLASGYDKTSFMPKAQCMKATLWGPKHDDRYLGPFTGGSLHVRGCVRRVTRTKDLEIYVKIAKPLLNRPCSIDDFIVKVVWHERDLLPRIYTKSKVIGLIRPDTTCFDPRNVWLMPVYQAQRVSSFPRDIPLWMKWWSYTHDRHAGAAPLINSAMLIDKYDRHDSAWMFGNIMPFTLCGLALAKNEEGFFTRIGIFHMDFPFSSSPASRWFDKCEVVDIEIR